MFWLGNRQTRMSTNKYMICDFSFSIVIILRHWHVSQVATPNIQRHCFAVAESLATKFSTNAFMAATSSISTKMTWDLPCPCSKVSQLLRKGSHARDLWGITRFLALLLDLIFLRRVGRPYARSSWRDTLSIWLWHQLSNGQKPHPFWGANTLGWYIPPKRPSSTSPHLFELQLVGPTNQTFPGWWFQPLWKILVKMGIFPK